VNLDILYCSWNRASFTEFSFRMLLENTSWDRVRTLVVHDDDSSDGTTLLLKQHRQSKTAESHGVASVRWDFNRHLGSAPAVMSDFIGTTDADWFAKIDNDIVVPPGWLDAMLQVIEGDPSVDCLGMEAGRGNPRTPEWDGVYRFQDGSWMGGVGLIKVDAVRRLPEFAGQAGWSLLQGEYGKVTKNGPLNIGWINPDLPVVQLDRVRFEPWKKLTDYYVTEGWSRPWGKYHPGVDYFDWWPPEARNGG